MRWSERHPLCALQGRLSRIESEIDDLVAVADFGTQCLWRSVVEPEHVLHLVAVPFDLRDEYAELAAEVRKRQQQALRELLRAPHCVHCKVKLPGTKEPGVIYACASCGSMDWSFCP